MVALREIKNNKLKAFPCVKKKIEKDPSSSFCAKQNSILPQGVKGKKLYGRHFSAHSGTIKHMPAKWPKTG